VKNKIYLSVLFSFIFCSNIFAQNIVNKDSLINEIKVLSSDEFQGRRPFTLGEKKTIAYLKHQYRSIGVEPGNGKSYFQNVPMVEITPLAPPVVNIFSPTGKTELKNYDDYIVWTENASPLIVIDPSEVVFAGFGVTSPENNWDDYAGIDVRGKIVLVMVNDPGFTIDDSTLFKGKRMTYYGRWPYKFDEASRHGAKGCLIIHNTAAAGYPFSIIQNSNDGTKLHLDISGSKQFRSPLMGWITSDAATRLLQASGKDSSLFIAANKRGFKAVPLGIKISATIRSKAVFNVSHNVVAKITGTEKPDEYIILTGHWDHLGIGKPDEKGDSIYNGANDNASGTSVLIELARLFKNEKFKPKRSILFLSVTAEEQGLLGSAYYAAHPLYPLSKTVADINCDMLNITGKMKDVVIVGKGQNELENYYEEFAKLQGRYVTGEPSPQSGSYYRSDHFSFAKVGVPAIDAGGGNDLLDKAKDSLQQKKNEIKKNVYHTPSDEYSDRWNLEGALQDIELNYLLAKKLAYSNVWPGWKDGSEFKIIREKSRKNK
jgi:Zn-dependent M28 family amino/carboxypeptidase